MRKPHRWIHVRGVDIALTESNELIGCLIPIGKSPDARKRALRDAIGWK